jgi:hypothetical protein
MQLQQQQGWQASKRVITRATRAMAMPTVTKREMATNGDKMGNDYGKEGGGGATVATMAMGTGMAQRT